MQRRDSRVIVPNKKAKHEYFIEKVYEAGVQLKGTEVKSIRKGKVSVKESYVQIKNGEVFVVGMHITPYEFGNINNVDPLRDKKLLLRKKEIRDLKNSVDREGYTIVVLNVKLSNGLIKMDIALAKGKKLYDKRLSKKKEDMKRKIERVLKSY